MTDTQTPIPADSPQHAVDLIEDVFGREHEQRIDTATLERTLAELLERYPEAPVGAHSADGVMVAMPETVTLQRNPVLEARSGIDLVIHDEAVLRGWERVLAVGAAHYQVHPAGHPEITIDVHALDIREAHGVVIIVCVAAQRLSDGAGSAAATPDPLPAPAPRFATICKDAHAVILSIDEATTKILGWSAEEMKGRRGSEFMHPEDQPLAVDNWMEMLASPGPGRRVRLRHRRRDGSWVWFEVTNHNLLNDPDYRCVVSEVVDISEEMASHELLDRLAEAIPVGLFQVDAERNIAYTNDRLHEILRVGRMDTVDAQLASVSEADRPLLARSLDEVLAEGQPVDVEIEFSRQPGRERRLCAISLRPVGQDGTISGAIACVTDITDAARMREELKRRATFDDLTGCYNRVSIMSALERSIASGRRRSDRAVVFVDLDGFKEINDRLGHSAGDELLGIAAQRLASVVRDGDMVGRIGGDEFLLVCPDIGGPEQAMRLARRLADAQREEIRLGDTAVSINASIGVAWSDGQMTDADAIVASADRAMYASKRDGGGRPVLADSPTEA